MYTLDPVFNASAMLELLDIANVRVRHPRGGYTTLACLTHVIQLLDILAASRITLDEKNQAALKKIKETIFIQSLTQLFKRIQEAPVSDPQDMTHFRGIFVNSYDEGFQEIENLVVSKQVSAEEGLTLLQNLLAIPDIPENPWDTYTLIQAGIFSSKRISIPPFHVLTFPLRTSS